MSDPEQIKEDTFTDSLVETPSEHPLHPPEEVKKEESKESSPLPRAVIDKSFSRPMATPGEPVYGYYFSLPSVVYPKMVKLVSEINEGALDDNDPVTQKWKEVVNESTDPYTPEGMYTDNVFKETSEYLPGISDGKGKLNSISQIVLKEVTGDVRGEAAILMLSKKLGLGDFTRVPLAHSGLWVQLRPPLEQSILDFYNALAREKISLGRKTSGFVLSNFSVYTNQALMDFIIAHVHATNIVGLKPESLKDLILPQDFPILVWGFATAIYPNGFDYRRACINAPETCKHIEEANISLGKLYECDNTAFSEYQLQHMASYAMNSRTMEQLEKYKAEHTRIKNSHFLTKTGLRINLKTPTIKEHFEHGVKWVDHIVDSVEKIVLSDDEKATKEKDRLLSQYIRASLIRQYSHFIDSIDIDGANIKEEKSLRSALDVLSGDDSARVQILDEINKYIAETTFALICIPAFECPSCKQPQNTNPMNDRFTEVIPIDVVEVFFDLITLRINRVLERNI